MTGRSGGHGPDSVLRDLVLVAESELEVAPAALDRSVRQLRAELTDLDVEASAELGTSAYLPGLRAGCLLVVWTAELIRLNRIPSRPTLAPTQETELNLMTEYIVMPGRVYKEKEMPGWMHREVRDHEHRYVCDGHVFVDGRWGGLICEKCGR
jgi:hypothetical protein